MGRVGRWLVWGAGLLVAIPVVGVAIVLLMAPRSLASVSHEWAVAFESMEALTSRYPVVTESAGVVELNRLAGQLTTQVRSECVTWVASFSQGRETADLDVERVPATARALLAAARPAIDAIRTHLLGDAPLIWAQDIRAPDPGVDLAALRQLASVLLADAVSSAGGRDATRARESIEAVQRLERAIARRPDLVSQLVAMVLHSLRSGVARRLPAGFSGLGDGGPVVRHDWKASALTAIQIDALRLMSDSDRRGAGRLGARWWRWSVAGASRHILSVATELKTEDPCALDADAADARFDASRPRWNVVARVYGPGLVRSWVAAGLAAVDDELTGWVSLAQAGRTLPLHGASRACAGLTWTMAVQEDGGLRIAAPPAAFHDPARAPVFLFRQRKFK